MQNVELGEWNAPRPHLLHAGLVFVAPGIREAQPIGLVSERLQHRLGLAPNAGAPIDKGAEYIEEQRFDSGKLSFRHDRDGRYGGLAIPHRDTEQTYPFHATAPTYRCVVCRVPARRSLAIQS